MFWKSGIFWTGLALVCEVLNLIIIILQKFFPDVAAMIDSFFK